MQLVPRPSHSSFPENSSLGKTSQYKQLIPSDPEERVVILIDGANLFYAAMQLGMEIDYTRLLQCLTGDRSLVRAYFYTGVDRANEKQQRFLLWMRHNGFRVVSKELIQHPDGSKKADLNIEIAVDMITLSQHCDTIILLSGTGDLTYAVDHVSYRGVKIEVVSLPTMTSDSLIHVSDHFIDLTHLKPNIEKLRPAQERIPD
ncbi:MULTISPECIES: NYN domain-containing protein [Leptolyngbya]|uniref:LabA-like NYN domain-containing protein n=1 Tax=Leptolyngbya TaxID=47251 RepID=UPI001687D6B7|nr:NYN domain-containing protein [Leptolyngbya sp. FACHB-1624]MBD1855955.1 NYN domain-containing protein [Leptolyngbya sp. FACHB-1624]